MPVRKKDFRLDVAFMTCNAYICHSMYPPFVLSFRMNMNDDFKKKEKF